MGYPNVDDRSNRFLGVCCGMVAQDKMVLGIVVWIRTAWGESGGVGSFVPQCESKRDCIRVVTNTEVVEGMGETPYQGRFSLSPPDGS
eukprot:SAG31_NODE_442_length_15661_cov_4.132245_14_plen_88_part_00